MTTRPPFVHRPLRVEAGDALAAAGAIVLLVSLFLTWYAPDLTAWTCFELLDLLLAALALASLAAVAGELGAPRAVPARWLPALGGAATVIVVAALINHPPLALGHPPRAGIWIAFGASLLMVAGALLRVARVSFAVTFDSAEPQRPPPPPEAHTEPLPPE